MEWFGEHQPTAIVTGGASGIGRAVCELLAKEGYRVAVADRDKAGADDVAQHIDGHAFAVDVADEASVVALFEAALTLFDGTLDALATPAGIADTTPFMDLTVDTFRRVHEINVVGTFLCIREAAKRMKPGGRICTVASVAGKRGGGLAGSAARALAPHGIAVNCVAPGPTLTPMLDEPFKNPGQRERVEALTLLGRSGEPREIAEAITWLLSPRSSFVDGETLTVDGGLMLD